jgi:hypothetical protein
MLDAVTVGGDKGAEHVLKKNMIYPIASMQYIHLMPHLHTYYGVFFFFHGEVTGLNAPPPPLVNLE